MSRILVIEDERNVRENIVELLTLEGYEPFSAENGQKGYFLAITEPFDLVICDILMPIMDGFEVVRRIRKHPRGQTLPVIFLTAKTQRDSMREGMELGADDYISKPFTRKELLNSIQTRLSKQRASESAMQAKINLFETKFSLLLPLEILNSLTGIRELSEWLYQPEKNTRTVDTAQIGKIIHRSTQDLIETMAKYLFLHDLEAFSKYRSDPGHDRIVHNAGTFIESILREKTDQIQISFSQEFSLSISEDELSKLIEIVGEDLNRYADVEKPVQLEMKIDELDNWVNLKFLIARKRDQSSILLDSHEDSWVYGLDRDIVILTRIVALLDGQILTNQEASNTMELEIRLPVAKVEED